MNQIIAVIVAAGSGTRFGGKKQYTEVSGKPLYYYSIKAFKSIADRIILVVPAEDADQIEGFGAEIIAGGAQRYDSVYNALKYLRDNPVKETAGRCFDEDDLDEAIVLIHDAVRPMITAEVIERVIEDTRHHVGAVATVPVVDTIRTRDGRLVDRDNLRAMQTPQGFKYCMIKLAYDMFMSLNDEAKAELHITDDVEVLKRTLGMDSFMSEGSPDNIKITTPEDMRFIRLD